ncbi:NAD(P)/FAD-dependent oxidoreductase [Brevibacterium sp. ACRRH]|uniref:FAD-dependent oxidoreductase n=1 Tax=Brevibacterium sp. ACRRH TaxID=2918183 RepID=UPI001EF56423|nr:FAD/NAD(P)-binding oxidoreductase [Brevibacterium sp. ACRRH]MCG7297538.1 NAD(P)/FAD-dependent oxidoreductase [Brevibacterium sp. ACRRH]
MRVVIIGGGAAGTACAHSFVQTISQAESGMVDECGVTVVDRLEQPVELPPLSKSLAAQELSLVPHVLGENVVRVQGTVSKVRPAEPSDRARYIVETTVGELPADAVVYATGLTPRTPAFDALTVYDRASTTRAHQAIRALEPGTSVGVLGSGFLALEIARGLADAGHHPHVYLRGDRPLPKVSAHLAHAVVALHEHVTFVPLTPEPDPSQHPLWFAAVGATSAGPALPSTETNPNSNPEPSPAGYPVSPDLQVAGLPGVYAIGDCARVEEGPMKGSEPAEAAATSMGRWLGAVLGEQAAGKKATGQQPTGQQPTGQHPAKEEPTWTDVPWHWSFQGPVRIFTAGKNLSATNGEPVQLGDSTRRAQWLFFAPDGTLARVETLNNPGAHNAAKRVLASHDLPHRSDVDQTFDMRAWASR